MRRLNININAFTIKKYFVGRHPRQIVLRIRNAIFYYRKIKIKLFAYLINCRYTICIPRGSCFKAIKYIFSCTERRRYTVFLF